ncbi:MAG TPA: DUF2510 domain-containing protein [Amnibacterium sp.]|jgi:hypothetical protein|uniref:DUF2510 domain-containing protein n=1 Tax=Amnibacterium sp. TaxID=1872496 RepID=UPI002F95BCFE
MTRLDIAPRAAGWYPDPRGTSATRFWDGSEWTQHVKGTGMRFAPPATGTAVEPGAIAPLVTLPRNGAATAALVLGIASLVVNLLLIPSILAVVLGVVGLVRGTRFGGSGEGRAIAGILLGVGGALAVLVELVLLAPVLLGLQHEARIPALRSTVINQAATQGVRLSDVTCPATVDPRTPGRFTCEAFGADGAHLSIAVTVAEGGAWTWRASRG